MATYPETPPGSTAVHQQHTGSFTTHVKFLREDGGTTEWHSRAHRKDASLHYVETANADRGPGRVGARRRLRLLSVEPHRIEWWAAIVQLAGTLFSCRSLGDAERLANAGRMRMGKAIRVAEDGAWVRSGRVARHSRAVCWSCVAMSGSAPE